MRVFLTAFTVFILSSVQAQMLDEGDWVVEAGMGFPNLMPTVIEPNGVIHGAFDFGNDDVKSFGQLVLRSEFFLSERIGFAASFNYGFFRTFYEAFYDEYQPATQSYIPRVYYYDTKVHKLRFTAGLNFHALRTERVDSYFGFAAGSKKAYTSYKTNDPYIVDSPIALVFPFALRAHYGFRIFFNNSLALNMELGLGGPIISGGLTYKINYE